MITELAEKGSLADFLHEGVVVKANGHQEPTQRALGKEQALEVFVQIALSLLYCHKHRVLHRDLKPANVLMMMDGSIRLADFGAGREVEDISDLVKTVVGTPYVS
jgi:serine/threonine protein kinase